MGRRRNWIGVDETDPELLRELTKLEGIVDSLVIIPNKPAQLKKQWRDTLSSYERTAELCVTYAKRHMPKAVNTGQLN